MTLVAASAYIFVLRRDDEKGGMGLVLHHCSQERGKLRKLGLVASGQSGQDSTTFLPYLSPVKGAVSRIHTLQISRDRAVKNVAS